MRTATRIILAPALAASLIVLYEVLRAALFGANTLGGDLPGFALGVAGLLGLPLWLAGLIGLGGVAAARGGWRWGRDGAEPPTTDRVVAWALFGAVALAVIVFTTQNATIYFVKAFRKPVYEGLATGLVAALAVLVLAALSGPAVGLGARILRAISRRVPPILDPSRPSVAIGGAVALLILGAILAPIIVKPLHTVDLRPARLMLAWALLLGGAHALLGRRPPGRWGLATGLALGALFAIGMVWSLGSLGESQRRRLTLDRDTLLAGPLTAQLNRLGDADGDGVSRLFAGGDCDDDDPDIRPGVYDAPDDGVDQNCTGADLVLADDPIRRPQRPSPVAERNHNVVLLTIDALRHDVVAANMPRLQALADEAIDVRNAYSHGAATYWSIPALLASTLPSRLEMGRDQTPVGGMKLLPEVLRDAGWHTALFANVTVFFVRGLRQGAQVADYSTSDHTVHGDKPGAAHMTDNLLKHVDAFAAGRLRPKRDRFFVWAHYYDPHDPYFEVPGYPADDDSDAARYAAITRYLDAELGRLFDGLKQRGLWDDTLIVLTADHGDEFLDHGHRFHGRTLYEEMVHVPLIMKVPGVGHRVIEAPMGQMELAPTLLDLLGRPIPGPWVGRSRADEIRGGPAAPVEPVFFEVFPDSNYDAWQVGVRRGDLKLIHRIDRNYFELYDLAADPLERDNVFDSHPEAAALTAELMVYEDHHLYHLGRGRTGAKLPPGAPGKKSDKGKKSRSKARKRSRPTRRAKPKPRSRAPKPAKPTPAPPNPAPKSLGPVKAPPPVKAPAPAAPPAAPLKVSPR